MVVVRRRERPGAEAPDRREEEEGEDEMEEDDGGTMQVPPPPPSLPYKVDTSRPSLRTNWTRHGGTMQDDGEESWDDHGSGVPSSIPGSSVLAGGGAKLVDVSLQEEEAKAVVGRRVWRAGEAGVISRHVPGSDTLIIEWDNVARPGAPPPPPSPAAAQRFLRNRPPVA